MPTNFCRFSLCKYSLSVISFSLIYIPTLPYTPGATYWWRRWRRRRRYEISATDAKQNEVELFGPSQCLVISNDPGGGEEDIHMDRHHDHVHARVPSASSASMTSIPKAQLTNSATELPRATTPTISAIIQQQVAAADREVLNIDGTMQFHDEGDGSIVGSLSSICSTLEDEQEEYTIDRLREAGPNFQPLVSMLEVILEEENIDSVSEVTNTTQ